MSETPQEWRIFLTTQIQKQLAICLQMAHLVVVDYFASALNSTLCTFAFMGSFLANNPSCRAEVVYSYQLGHRVFSLQIQK